MAGMMERLADVPLDAGAVVCLGLRLDDFPSAAWRGACEFLASAPWVSRDERERARRYLRCEDAARHLLGRCLLRHALGRWGQRALPVAWPVNAWGKPEAWGGVHFSISHAGGHVWLACCRAGDVGIDVEDATPAAEDLTPWLHPEESASLSGQGDPASRRRLWARKEALVKAVGMGLSLPLRDFRVAVDPRPADWLLQAPAAFPAPWSSFDIPVPGEVAAALAVRSRGVTPSWRLGCLRWQA